MSLTLITYSVEWKKNFSNLQKKIGNKIEGKPNDSQKASAKIQVLNFSNILRLLEYCVEFLSE